MNLLDARVMNRGFGFGETRENARGVRFDRRIERAAFNDGKDMTQMPVRVGFFGVDFDMRRRDAAPHHAARLNRKAGHLKLA